MFEKAGGEDARWDEGGTRSMPSAADEGPASLTGGRAGLGIGCIGGAADVGEMSSATATAGLKEVGGLAIPLGLGLK